MRSGAARLLRDALTPLALVGALVSTLAAFASIGLLSTAGWFITACAIAGASIASTFSYVIPSGIVRAFAVGRIAADYGKRYVQHRAALDRLERVRVGAFERAGRAQGERTLVEGAALDRLIADADEVSMSGIRAFSPLADAGILAVCGVWAVWTIAWGAGLALLITVLLVPLAVEASLSLAERAGQEQGVARARSRGRLVDVVIARGELLGLGATGRARVDVARDLEDYTGSRRRWGEISALAGGAGTLVSAVGLAVVVLLCVMAGAEPGRVVLSALLVMGLEQLASALPEAFRSRRAAVAAATRLDDLGRGAVEVPTPGIHFDERGLVLDRYRVAESVYAPGHEVSATVSRGSVLVVTGRSGIGKSTLLAAIARTVGREALYVPVDDAIFSATVLENLGIADPSILDDEGAADALLAAVGLESLAASSPVGTGGRELSGGERTRIRVARSLLADRPLLLLDEPTAGLDRATAERVLKAAVERRRGTLVLAVHSADVLPESVATLADVKVLAL